MSDQGEIDVNTDTRRPVIVGSTIFAALFILGIGWLYISKLSGAVIATGTVVVQGKPKTIQHLDGGLVSKINVVDGDRVIKGDVLIQLDAALLNTNLKIYRNRLREGLARQARLMAERDANSVIDWNIPMLQLLVIEQNLTIQQGHQKLFEARQTSLDGQIEQLGEQQAQFQNQIKGVNSLRLSKIQQKKMLSHELENLSSLVKKGLVTNNQVMGLERQREELNGQIGEHEAELARIQNSINESKIQALQIKRDFNQSVLTELREVEQEINDVTQQYQSTTQQLQRVDIRAPVDGIVHELNVFTLGGVVGPGAQIMQIIPQSQNFIIEANVEPQHIDELYSGQEAAIRFSAFNQRSTPELVGYVSSISANVLVDEQSTAPYYKINIIVTDEELSRLKGQKLIPGMPVEAFIKTQERTALNYLVKPLLDQINRAFREE